jgi:acetate kinase
MRINLEDLFDQQSGLRGISCATSDVRELIKQRATNPNADLALHMFCYQVHKAIGSLAAALNGIDLLVFTGGIGEHADDLHKDIVAGLRFIGPGLKAITLPAQEDEQIARNTSELIDQLRRKPVPVPLQH